MNGDVRPPTGERNDVSLHDFVKVIRQRWLVILLSTLVAATVMFLVTPARTDTTQRIGSYTATATLLVGARPVSIPPNGQFTTGESVSLGRIALFITTGEIPKRAAAKLAYTGDPALLASGLKVETDTDSTAITITTTASDGARAAQVANAFADEAVAYFEERPAGGGNATLTIMQRATPIPNASTAGFVIPPDRTIRTALAAALGLLFGLALALLLDRLDSRLRTRGEIAQALRLPVIGEVPRLRRRERGDGTILSVSQPLSTYADGYRAARTALMHLPTQQVGGEWVVRHPDITADDAPEVTRVVLVSSAHPSEGKTTSVANLAASFAETGQKVLVLDADLRNPDLHQKFDVPQGAGISDYLTDPTGTPLETLLRPTGVNGVRILTAGTRLDFPASLSSRMGPLLAEARAIADVVIVDTAPLLAASDVFDILPLSDTIVLVVRSGRITSNVASRVSELLGRFRVPVTGAIVIGAPVRKADYGYGYAAGYGEKERTHRRGIEPAPVVVGADDTDEAAPPPRRSR